MKILIAGCGLRLLLRLGYVRFKYMPSAVRQLSAACGAIIFTPVLTAGYGGMEFIMFNEIMSLALGNGLWAALFCLLFLYQLKDSRDREKKYTLTINSLTQSLGGLKDVKKDCESIKADCCVIKSDCEAIRTESGKALDGIKKLSVSGRKTKQKKEDEEGEL